LKGEGNDYIYREEREREKRGRKEERMREGGEREDMFVLIKTRRVRERGGNLYSMSPSV
jgi:hypothetical protein